MKKIRSDILSSFEKLDHGFIYDSGNGGDPEGILLSDYKCVRTLQQIHSDIVIGIDGTNMFDKEFSGDAMYTVKEGICLGIYTADCVPVILYEPKCNVIAAIHAGWRGTVNGITGKALRAIGDELGSDMNEINAVIGPSIGRCCYEVDDDVASEFRKKFNNCDDYIYRSEKGKYIVDLVEANFSQLRQSGVNNIEAIHMCTKCNEELPSYRREGSGTGRIFSFIGLV